MEPMNRLVFLHPWISPTPELMPLQSNFYSVKSNLWTISQVSSWSPEQSNKLIQALRPPLETVDQSRGNSTSKSVPILTEPKTKRRKRRNYWNYCITAQGFRQLRFPSFPPIFLAPALLTIRHLQKKALQLLYFLKDQLTQVRTSWLLIPPQAL